MKEYLFTVIVCYKDTEKYIQDTMDSLYRQTCGFREFVQVIMVNDGSKDSSKSIAEMNKKYYPDNILIVDSEGVGVAAAKNTGLKYAKGKYVNFLDSDDYLSDDALLKVHHFFEEHEEIDIVAIPIYFFENQSGSHMLNDKFTFSRVIDVNEEPESIQLSSASSFVRSASIKQSFDEELSIGEDSLFITSMIVEKMKYGVVADVQYHYRKRADGSSVMQNTYGNITYYTSFMDNFILRLISECKDHNVISKYLQHVIAYNIQWPLRKQESPKGISKKIITEYWKKIDEVLKYLDVDVIKSMKYLSFHQKQYLLSRKNLKSEYRVKDNNVYIERENEILDKLSNLECQILEFQKKDTSLVIIGRIGSLFKNDDLKVYGEISGKKMSSKQYIERKTMMIGTVVKEFTDFKITIPLDSLVENTNVYIIAECEGVKKKVKIKNEFLVNKKITHQEKSIHLKYSKTKKSVLVSVMEHAYKYKISVLMTIDNAAEYLEEAIESIIFQDIGFEDNVQLILINCGSTDHSDEICQKYHQEYPSNVLYVREKSMTIASARNSALQYREGEFVNFFEPTDKVESHVFRNVYNFFEENYYNVEFVSLPMQLLDGKENLNPKYHNVPKKNILVDLDKEPEKFVPTVAASFYKTEIFHTVKFDGDLICGEDLKLNCHIYIDNPCFGMVAQEGNVYKYRGRTVADAMTNINLDNPQSYYDIIKVLEEIVSGYSENNVPNYVKEIILYQVKMIYQEIQEDIFLDMDEYNTVMNRVKGFIKLVGAQAIMESKVLNTKAEKYYFLNSLDGNKNLFYINNDGYFTYNNLVLFPLKTFHLTIRKAEVKKDYVEFISFHHNFDMSFELIMTDSSNRRYAGETRILNSSYDAKVGQFCASKTTQTIMRVPYKKGIYKFYYLDKENNKTYPVKVIKLVGKNNFELKDSEIKVFKEGYDIRFFNNKIKIRPKNTDLLKYKLWSIKYIKEKYHHLPISRLFNLTKKDVILLNDRVNKANDNAEAVFVYMNEKEKELAEKTYFVISKDSPDYKRLKKIGNVVAHGSLKHKALYMNAKVIASSHIRKDFYRPFANHVHKYYADMLDYKFLWLQHGIIMNDNSRSVNKYAHSVDYMVTSTNEEYNEFRTDKYLYDEGDVLLTGLARFDKLCNKSKNIITIAPTWRAGLTGIILPSGLHECKEGFEESQYYKQYAKVLTDPHLLNVAEKEGYKIHFILHPAMLGYIEMFRKFENGYVKILSASDIDYTKVFNESLLLVTDYSSINFDFAYLKKPLIYFQFDQDDFFGKHYKEGYFSYQDNGFGDVVTDAGRLVEKVIYYAGNDFKSEDKYIQRIDATFKYTDRNNCKRVVEHLKEVYYQN